MAQDGTAHNGKVCIGSQEIVWELLNEVKQLPEGRLIYLHGNMPAIKHDAVFIVIYIRRILEPHWLSLIVTGMILWLFLAG